MAKVNVNRENINEAKSSSRVKPTLSKIESITRSVVLKGTRPIMFDRYAGDNNTKLEVWQKLYFTGDGETLILPSTNIMSFLSAHNTNSSPKRLRDSRKFKKIADACLSFIEVNPDLIPFTRDGEVIKFGKFDGDEDPLSGVYIHRSVARLDKGIPNPKVRPTLPLPWELSFDLTILKNSEITEQDILNLFDEGGRAIGLGTFRGQFGKFIVESWD